MAAEENASGRKRARDAVASRPGGPMEDAFDPAQFRALGHQLVDSLGDYLERALAGGDLPVLPRATPAEALEATDPSFPAEPGDGFLASLEDLIERSNHLHHPRYLGHQVPPVMPLAALAELTRALLNGGTAIFEMGPALAAIERRLVRFLLDGVGYGPQADGFLTSGGSLGNLTALLAMRQVQTAGEAWNAGGARGFAVLASSESHYSIGRAVRVMGWGSDGIATVPVDASFRMVPAELERAKARAEDGGRRVLGVVANACSTTTGAFDPLDAIADYCEAQGLWFHVDGAHGASYLLSGKHRALLDGVARADSVIWDLHKMMLLPSLVTAVLFRKREHSFATFDQDASYVFRDADSDDRLFEMGLRTFECTRGGLAAAAYTALRACGTDALAGYLDGTIELARTFAERVERSPHFELAVAPMCNIVCFRRIDPACADLDALQRRIRERVVASERFYIVTAPIHREGGRALFLRVTLIHPFSTIADLEALLDELLEAEEAEA